MAGQHIIRVGGVFTSLITQDRDNRQLWMGDSKTYDATATDQGFSMGAAMEMFDLPKRSDGSHPIVGMAGPAYSSGSSVLSRLWGQPSIFSGTAQGWTRTGTAPDGTFTGASPETKHTPSLACYYTIAAGTSRVAHADPVASNTVGVAWSATASLHDGNASKASACYCQIGRGGNPFSGKQTVARLIGDHAGADGADDMRIRPSRQVDGSMTWNANNTWTGSPTTMDLSEAAGPWMYDVDCGAGYGLPTVSVINPIDPASGVATALKMIFTGIRMFRDSSGVPITGTSFACMGYTGFNADQFAGQIGVSGYTELYSAANASQWIQWMCGRDTSGSKYANIVWLNTGNNPTSAEQTDLQTIQAGGSGTHVARDNIIAIINQHKANAAALGDPVPQFIVTFAEWHSHDFGASNDDAGFDIAWRDDLRAACAATGAEFVDLFGETWDGVTRNYALGPGGGAITLAEKQARWPWCKGAGTFSKSGSGSGPVEDTTADFVHLSLIGAYWIWRMVWEVGMEGIGKTPGVTIDYPRADAITGGGRASMSVR